MDWSTDTWPKPSYDVGPEAHLHAVGVIAVCYNAFERGLLDLYRQYMDDRVPGEVSEFFYLSLNERARAEALEVVVHACEKDPMVVEFFDSLMKYFSWCWNARNQIVHSEYYPAMFGGNALELTLTKRRSKQSAEVGYLNFKLEELREIADKINEGVRRCAAFRIHLRQRSSPPEKWPVSLRAHGHEPLPGKLALPNPVTLVPHPTLGVPRRRPPPSQK